MGSINSVYVVAEYRRRIGTDAPRFLWSDWLAQANHVFDSPGTALHLNDYVLVDLIQFSLILSEPRDDPPQGYLFPDLQSEFPTSFRIPDCPVYWSFDPSGTERLSAEEASNHRFPDFTFGMEIFGKSWDSLVYAGLGQFHQAKGFDPRSREVAMELGLSLVDVSGFHNALFPPSRSTGLGISSRYRYILTSCAREFF
ncbi:hypothetical protein C8J57DRAFT_1085552 [Mycena rebaudengoi]|nr:hypothetical protein C8J57DRAFT_1085552 [Mycena rebaudengoi]